MEAEEEREFMRVHLDKWRNATGFTYRDSIEQQIGCWERAPNVSR